MYADKFKQIVKYFCDHRIFVDPIGDTRVTTLKSKSPITVFNSEDTTRQFLYKLMSVSTDEEIKKLKKRDFSKGAYAEFQKRQAIEKIEDKMYNLINKLYDDVEKVDEEFIDNTVKFSKSLKLYCNVPQDVITKYDSKDTLIYMNISGSLDEKVSKFNSLMTVSKADFVFTTKLDTDFCSLLADDNIDLNMFVMKNENGEQILLGGNYQLPETTELVKWHGEVYPDKLNFSKVKATKLDLSGFVNIDELYASIRVIMTDLFNKGGFGNVDAENPDIWVDSISETTVIVDLWDEGVYKTFRVPINVENKTITITDDPIQVERVCVFVSEDEDVKIVRSGSQEDTEDNQEGNENNSSESSEPAESSEQTDKSNIVDLSDNDLVMRRKMKMFKGTEEDEDDLGYHYVLGVVLEPNDGIDGDYNPDTQDDVYGALDIQKAAHQWMTNYLNIGIMHESLAGKALVPCESYLAPADMEVNGEKIIKGSWVLGAVIDDEQVWDAIQKEQFTGWSIGGWAERNPVE